MCGHETEIACKGKCLMCLKLAYRIPELVDLMQNKLNELIFCQLFRWKVTAHMGPHREKQ